MRNRLKRWARVYFRSEAEQLSGFDCNLVLLKRESDFYSSILREQFIDALEQGKIKIKKSVRR